MRHKIPLNVTIEVVNGPRVSRPTLVTALPDFEITRTVVTAKSRTLTAKWTIEMNEAIVWANGAPVFTKR